MRHAATRMLFAYWDGLRGERAAPDRGEIEPGAIRHVLADTFILSTEASPEPAFRLAGTRLCALFGGELREKTLADLWELQGRAEIRRLMDAVMDDAAGAVAGITGTTETGQSIELELLLLPLRHRGKTHARMLGALSPRSVPAWLGLEPVVALRTVSIRVIWPSGRRSAMEERDMVRRRLVVLQGGRA